MNIKEFIKESARTMAPVWHPQNIHIETLHGIIGVSTEAGELLDAVKKSLFYGHDLDRENIREEIGDILWYIAAIIRNENWDIEEIMEENINKLKQRYPEQFTKELSSIRLDKK